MRRLRRLVVLPVAVLVASCSTDTTTSSDNTLSPTTTLFSTTTTTTAVATTTTILDASTTVATTTPAPTTDPLATTAVAAPSAEIAAAFIGGAEGDFWLPLGYWDGSHWVQLGEEGDALPLEFPAATGDSIRVTGLELAPTAAALGDSGEACFDGQVGFAVAVAAPIPEPPGFGYSAIGVAAEWEIQPRPTQQVGLQIDQYRQIGATFADDLGVDGTLGKVVQVVRADLDGDGMEEVLVAFEHAEESIRGAPGDYSIVYLRVPHIDGSVDDSVVFSSFVDPDLPDDELPFINMARVLGVADLNGDGRMEVALHTWYYEGAGVSAFEFDGAGLTQVMGNGCGA
jgi:hypothetical protein